MYSNTKILLLLFFLFSLTLLAQENKEEALQEKDEFYGILTIGPYYPIAYGDNFAHQALDQKLGGQITLAISLFYTDFILGAHFNFYNAEVKNIGLAGNYESSNSNLIGLIVGYQFFSQEKIKFLFTGGVGSATYKNKDDYQLNFRDTATSIWITPEISYHFHQNIGAYFSGSLRHDFMKTEAPAPIEDFFKSANYVNLSVGVRIDL